MAIAFVARRGIAIPWLMVTAKAKALILASEILKKLAVVATPLIRLADSVFVSSVKKRT